jgi:hypothetical protein
MPNFRLFAPVDSGDSHGTPWRVGPAADSLTS